MLPFYLSRRNVGTEKLAIVKDRAINFLKTILHFGGLLPALGGAEKCSNYFHYRAHKNLMIRFTKHAEEKLAVLRRHKFIVTKSQVLATIAHPDIMDYSRAPLLIAQSRIDSKHVLRVVYRVTGEEIIIITFYPGRSNQYD
ncbi:MAG: hypothetical protein EXS55_03390 [Candidatus Magasanikbacteria bacterium]|nr:hypothetical protein [Candidatus Magasanikbacteria bacterium]